MITHAFCLWCLWWVIAKIFLQSMAPVIPSCLSRLSIKYLTINNGFKVTPLSFSTQCIFYQDICIFCLGFYLLCLLPWHEILIFNLRFVLVHFTFILIRQRDKQLIHLKKMEIYHVHVFNHILLYFNNTWKNKQQYSIKLQFVMNTWTIC